MSSSLNVLTTRPTGLRGRGPANRPRQAAYYWKDPITTCSSRLRALSTRPSFVSHLLICCGLLIFLPLSLWAELGETVQDNTDAAAVVVAPCPSRVLSGASIICTQLSPQPVPGPSRRRPITSQTGFGSGQAVESSHASIPHRSAVSCLVLVP